jgi:hypothetical protein
MIGVPFAHVGGIPIEETLASLGPALLVGVAATWANLRARLRGARRRAGAHALRARSGHSAGGPV